MMFFNEVAIKQLFFDENMTELVVQERRRVKCF